LGEAKTEMKYPAHCSKKGQSAGFLYH